MGARGKGSCFHSKGLPSLFAPASLFEKRRRGALGVCSGKWGGAMESWSIVDRMQRCWRAAQHLGSQHVSGRGFEQPQGVDSRPC